MLVMCVLLEKSLRGGQRNYQFVCSNQAFYVVTHYGGLTKLSYNEISPILYPTVLHFRDTFLVYFRTTDQLSQKC